MKKIASGIIMLLSLSTFAEYKYMNKEITETQFEKLHTSFGKYIYAFETKTYDFSTSEPNKLRLFNDNDDVYGIVSVRINSVDAEKKTIAAERIDEAATKQIDQSGKRCLIINANCKNLKDKAELPVLKLDKSKYDYPSLTNATALLTQLQVAGKDQFKTYLDNGGVCYEFKRTTPELVKCDHCKGAGKVHNPSYNSKEKNSPQYITCTHCKGTGKIKPAHIQYSKDKIALTK